MKNLIRPVINAFEASPAKTFVALSGLFVVAFISFLIITSLLYDILPYELREWFFMSALPYPLTFLVFVFGVLLLSRRLSFLSWLWHTNDETADSMEPKPSQTYGAPTFFERVRETPKGTRIFVANNREAEFEIKAALRFWFWFLPALFAGSAMFIGVPLGAFIGLSLSRDAVYRGGNPGNYVLSGIVWTVAAFVILAVISYFRTRQWIRISAKEDRVVVRGKAYERKYYSGMRLGYSIQDEEGLKNDIFDQSMGLTAIRLTYGRWGEDLPYLVNKYHAPAIVIWMNELIGAVGAPAPRENAPSEGRREQSF